MMFSATLFSLSTKAANLEQMVTANKQLLTSCQSLKKNVEAKQSVACIAYIQGLLAGAWGFPDIKTTHTKDKNKKPKTWAERAYRYRVGEISPRYLPRKTSYFCAPDIDTEIKIIKVFTSYKTRSMEDIRALNTRIYEAIKSVCPTVGIK
ncbi:MAG: hypothetical protein Q9M92_09860 [Enterobacterales bacterium]|nr:hypothetical protein [Enterobacterales bacterium]